MDSCFTCDTLNLLCDDHVEGARLRDDSHVEASLVQGQPSGACFVAMVEVLALGQLKVLCKQDSFVIVSCKKKLPSKTILYIQATFSGLTLLI